MQSAPSADGPAVRIRVRGLLTPTLKLKRTRIIERFRDRIEQVYREAPLE
jgi:long-subunit acyl-CoA synthetase (AMP-forming)